MCPIHYATHRGHVDVVKLPLAKEGVDVNIGTEGLSPPHDRPSCGPLSSCKKGINIKLELPRMYTAALHLVSLAGPLEAAKAFFELDGIEAENEIEPQGMTPLIMPAVVGHAVVVKLLGTRVNADLNRSVFPKGTQSYTGHQLDDTLK